MVKQEMRLELMTEANGNNMIDLIWRDEENEVE